MSKSYLAAILSWRFDGPTPIWWNFIAPGSLVYKIYPSKSMEL